VEFRAEQACGEVLNRALMYNAVDENGTTLAGRTADATVITAAAATATPTPTRTSAPPASPTATRTPTCTRTPTRTRTPTATRTPTPTPTDVGTPPATGTATVTATRTRTPTATRTATPTRARTTTPTASPMPGVHSVYLPCILQDYLVDFCEPNDNWDQAFCSLISGRTYNAYVFSEQDAFDWYFVDLFSEHTIEAWLEDMAAGMDLDLSIYGSDLRQVGHSGNLGNAAEHILTDPVPAGRYYVRIIRGYGHSRTQPYSLRVVYQ
jgi:hypothetical protein